MTTTNTTPTTFKKGSEMTYNYYADPALNVAPLVITRINIGGPRGTTIWAEDPVFSAASSVWTLKEFRADIATGRVVLH